MTERFHRVWTAPFIQAAVMRGWWQSRRDDMAAADRAREEARVVLFTARMRAADLHTDFKDFGRQQ
jgi:hypothetical protein